MSNAADLLAEVLRVLRTPLGRASGVMVHSDSIRGVFGQEPEEWAAANGLQVEELTDTAIHVKLRE